ncbi:MAG: hypothetical protein E6Q50_18170 [Lysobacter sp.]|nr:MAG: hypothetical protein E6Q50_18170 [Lysobacter sp.]
MQIETCQVGGALRLDGGIDLTIHRRQGKRVVLGVSAPVGTALTLSGADLRPACSSPGTWSYLFSLQATRRFQIGDFDVRIWLPGELVPSAACEDRLHVGIAQRSDTASCRSLSRFPDAALPASVVPGRPLGRAADGGRPFRRSA